MAPHFGIDADRRAARPARPASAPSTRWPRSSSGGATSTGSPTAPSRRTPGRRWARSSQAGRHLTHRHAPPRSAEAPGRPAPTARSAACRSSPSTPPATGAEATSRSSCCTGSHVVLRLRRRPRPAAPPAAGSCSSTCSATGCPPSLTAPTRWRCRPTSPRPSSADARHRSALALLTHDMGDTVGGELLARQAEGAWPVEVTQRVRDQREHLHRPGPPDRRPAVAALLPDELLARGPPDRRRRPRRRACAATFSAAPRRAAAGTDDPCRDAAEHIVHGDGQRVLPRLIRYIEERRANERRFTGAIEQTRLRCTSSGGSKTPSPCPSMVDTLWPPARDGAPPCASTTSGTTRWSRPAASLLACPPLPLL